VPKASDILSGTGRTKARDLIDAQAKDRSARSALLDTIPREATVRPRPAISEATTPANVANPGGETPFAHDVQTVATPIEKTLDILARPTFAGANVAHELLKRGDATQAPTFDLLGAAKRGITGEERRTYGDVLREDVNLPAVPAAILGFGADVALDPTTYTGFGAMTKAGRAAKAASIGLDVAEMSAAAARGAERFGHLRDVIRYRRELDALQGVREGERALLSFADRPIIKGQPIQDAATHILNRLGETRPGKLISETFRSEGQMAPEALRAAAYKPRAAGPLAQEAARRELQPLVKDYEATRKALGAEPEVFDDAMATAQELSKAKRFD